MNIEGMACSIMMMKKVSIKKLDTDVNFSVEINSIKGNFHF